MDRIAMSTMPDRSSGTDSRETKIEKGFGWSKSDVLPSSDDRSKVFFHLL